MKYKLTKLSIKEGETSAVNVGRSSTGNTIRVIRFVSPAEIKIDDEVYVGTDATNFIKTSPVQRIEEVDDNTYTMWTKTSVYHLEKKE